VLESFACERAEFFIAFGADKDDSGVTINNSVEHKVKRVIEFD